MIGWYALSLFARPLVAAEVITIAGTGADEFSGDGEPALKAELSQPFGLEIAPDGMLYFCDYSNHAVRRMDLKTGTISTVAGTGRKSGYAGDGGPAIRAHLHEPHELRFDREGNFYLSDTSSHVVRRVDAKNGVITTVAGTGKSGFRWRWRSSGDGSTTRICRLRCAFDAEIGLFICDIKNHRIRRVDFESGIISTFAGTG